MGIKVLHIGSADKFFPSYIDFVQSKFDSREHLFLLKQGMANLESSENVKVYKKNIYQRFNHYLYSFWYMHKAKKIILHGLFDINIVILLFIFPYLLSKCCWGIWGGDLYQYETENKSFIWYCREFFRKKVIKKIAVLLTYVPGDVEIARKWYGAEGLHVECLGFLSNIFIPFPVADRNHSTVNILVGNSADPSNRHSEVLDVLSRYADKNIKIFVPLSYGDEGYAKKIADKGLAQFGDKFVALTEFIPIDEYFRFLGTIDVAIFNHERQQAMGNLINLIGNGKTVYMNSTTSNFSFFKAMGLDVKDFNSFNDLEVFSSNKNKEIVQDYFSLTRLEEQWSRIFND